MINRSLHWLIPIVLCITIAGFAEYVFIQHIGRGITEKNIFNTGPSLLIAFLIEIFINFFGYTLLLLIYQQAYQRQEIDFGQSVKKTFCVMLKIIGLSIISILLIAVFIIAFKAMALMHAASIQSGNKPMTFAYEGLAILIGFSLIYLLYLCLLRWIFVFPAMIIHQKRFFSAFKMSYQISKKYCWLIVSRYHFFIMTFTLIGHLLSWDGQHRGYILEHLFTTMLAMPILLAMLLVIYNFCYTSYSKLGSK